MLPVTRKKVPIPGVERQASGSRPRVYPFNEMEVGQHFFVADRDENTLSSYASTMGKKLGRRFETRLCWMKRDKQVGWVPCEEGTRGAHRGVGVWRVE